MWICSKLYHNATLSSLGLTLFYFYVRESSLCLYFIIEENDLITIDNLGIKIILMWKCEYIKLNLSEVNYKRWVFLPDHQGEQKSKGKPEQLEQQSWIPLTTNKLRLLQLGALCEHFLTFSKHQDDLSIFLKFLK